MTDDAADGALPPDQNGFDIAAVLVGNEIGCETRCAGKVDDFDIVPGIVDQVVAFSGDGDEKGFDQFEVGVADPAQKVVERAVLVRL